VFLNADVLLFGKNLDRQIYSTQTIGGTGALGISARFLAQEKVATEVFISLPTWDNHRRLFAMSGFKIGTYPYYDSVKKGVDFSGICKTISLMPKGSVILLQAACHNPTGFDLTMDQWEEVLTLVKKHELLPFFDVAYQGFGTNPEEDVAMVRKFAEAGLEMIVTYSCSKNFGLYGERVGACFFLCNTKEEVEKIGSKIRQVIRGIYSSPPCNGARLVTIVLQDPHLYRIWYNELSSMRERIVKMRRLFAKELGNRLPKSSFSYIEEQKGMFSYTGLSEKGVEHLISEYGIYLTRDGRINIAGLPLPPKLEFVIDAFVKEFSEYGAKGDL